MQHMSRRGELTIRLDGMQGRAHTSAISILAPSMVPIIRQPFIWNFMLDVPDASVPAVLMC